MKATFRSLLSSMLMLACMAVCMIVLMQPAYASPPTSNSVTLIIDSMNLLNGALAGHNAVVILHNPVQMYPGAQARTTFRQRALGSRNLRASSDRYAYFLNYAPAMVRLGFTDPPPPKKPPVMQGPDCYPFPEPEPCPTS